MAQSNGRELLRQLVLEGALPLLPSGEIALPELVETARRQGLLPLLLRAVERERPGWAGPLMATLASERRAWLARGLAQIAVGARVASLLEAGGIRSLPLKGAVLAETVYDLESDRPMSDVDLLLLERWAEGVRLLLDAGFQLVARADHAWALLDPSSGALVEAHRSVTSAPGLFPLDAEGLWRRRRSGSRQLAALPSAEDLLLQLALHAAFQHGLVISLVQWLDFRRVLSREAVDGGLLLRLAAAARAERPLAAALVAARAVVGAPVPEALHRELAPHLGGTLGRWLAPRLESPLALVAPGPVALARARWELLAGRRSELLWRTLLVSETDPADASPAARLARVPRRAIRLVARLLSPHERAPARTRSSEGTSVDSPSPRRLR